MLLFIENGFLEAGNCLRLLSNHDSDVYTCLIPEQNFFNCLIDLSLLFVLF